MAVIVLTAKCNLSCPACFRPSRADQDARVWSFAELEHCLDELAARGQSFVAYTGGEPGLWCDGEISIADLLVASAQRGLSPMVVTNGYLFRDVASTSAVLERYFDLTDVPLQINLSVDHWHDGTWRDDRSPALDRTLRWRDAQPDPPSLRLSIVSLWCQDDARNIRSEKFARYVETGVVLQYLPLSPLGLPESLARLAPKVCPSGTDKSSLGSYGEIVRRKLGLPKEGWSALDNAELLGPCEAVNTLTLDLDGNWWLCNDRAGQSMRIASAGDLSAEAISRCFARNPLAARFQQDGFMDVLRQCAAGTGPIDAATVRSLLGRPHSYGISGRAACGVCRALPGSLFS